MSININHSETNTVRLLAAKYGLQLALRQFSSPQLQKELDQVNQELENIRQYIQDKEYESTR